MGVFKARKHKSYWGYFVAKPQQLYSTKAWMLSQGQAIVLVRALNKAARRRNRVLIDVETDYLTGTLVISKHTPQTGWERFDVGEPSGYC